MNVFKLHWTLSDVARHQSMVIHLGIVTLDTINSVYFKNRSGEMFSKPIIF